MGEIHYAGGEEKASGGESGRIRAKEKRILWKGTGSFQRR